MQIWVFLNIYISVGITFWLTWSTLNVVIAKDDNDKVHCCWCGKKYIGRARRLTSVSFNGENKLDDEFLDERNNQLIVQLHKNLRHQSIISQAYFNHKKLEYPFGYFASMEWLTKNLETNIKKNIGNVLHPVPPYVNTAIIRNILDLAYKNNLKIHYDTRHVWKNETQLTLEINMFKDHPAIDNWYLADEPDGEGDVENWRYPVGSSPNLLKERYQLVKSLDSSRPIHITLNCKYSAPIYEDGTDIISIDVYPIGITNDQCKDKTFGCCGCDNCKGNVKDVSNRLHYAYQSMKRHKQLHFVGQSFGSSEHWTRDPTPMELKSMTYVALTHNVKGIYYWLRTETESPLLSSTTEIYKEIQYIEDHLLYGISFIPHHSISSDIRMRAWIYKTKIIIVVVNMVSTSQSVSFHLCSLRYLPIDCLAGKIYAVFPTKRLHSDIGIVGNFSLTLEGFGTKVLEYQTSDIIRI